MCIRDRSRPANSDRRSPSVLSPIQFTGSPAGSMNSGREMTVILGSVKYTGETVRVRSLLNMDSRFRGNDGHGFPLSRDDRTFAGMTGCGAGQSYVEAFNMSSRKREYARWSVTTFRASAAACGSAGRDGSYLISQIAVSPAIGTLTPGFRIPAGSKACFIIA